VLVAPVPTKSGYFFPLSPTTGQPPTPSRQKLGGQTNSGQAGVGIGKIDLKGAQNQALKSFSRVNIEKPEDTGRKASILVRTQGEGGRLQIK